MLSMAMLINTWTIQLTKPQTNLSVIFEEEQKNFCTYWQVSSGQDHQFFLQSPLLTRRSILRNFSGLGNVDSYCNGHLLSLFKFLSEIHILRFQVWQIDGLSTSAGLFVFSCYRQNRICKQFQRVGWRLHPSLDIMQPVYQCCRQNFMMGLRLLRRPFHGMI